jgi:hypothetical protein
VNRERVNLTELVNEFRMKVILFLLLANVGWIKFGTFRTFDECHQTRDRVVSDNPDRIEGFCCMPTESECVAVEEQRKENE